MSVVKDDEYSPLPEHTLRVRSESTFTGEYSPCVVNSPLQHVPRPFWVNIHRSPLSERPFCGEFTQWRRIAGGRVPKCPPVKNAGRQNGRFAPQILAVRIG